MAMVFGLTGGIGAGKSIASAYLEDKGVYIVDADVIARQVVESDAGVLSEIVRYFGQGVLQDDGALNRKVLRDIIFKDRVQKVWLENLLHPIIRQHMEREISCCPIEYSGYILLVSPLLLETNQKKMVQRVLAIDASVDVRIKRIMQRDNVTYRSAVQVIQAQIGRERRLLEADDIVQNNDSLDTFYKHLDLIHRQYQAQNTA